MNTDCCPWLPCQSALAPPVADRTTWRRRSMDQFRFSAFPSRRVQPRHLLPAGMEITSYNHHAKVPSSPGALVLKPRLPGRSSLRSYPIILAAVGWTSFKMIVSSPLPLCISMRLCPLRNRSWPELGAAFCKSTMSARSGLCVCNAPPTGRQRCRKHECYSTWLRSICLLTAESCQLFFSV